MFNQTITNASGETLDYTFTGANPDKRRAEWIVVLAHGVTGNKDRPVINDTAQALNAAGFDTLAFSFAGNGASQGDFREATISKEIGDLRSVLDAVSPSYSKICVVGHSMGAAVAVSLAATDSRINALISLAGMVDTKAFAEKEFGSETPDSGLMWEEPDCPLSSLFMRDLCETIRTVSPAAERITQPWLLLYGSADDVVNPSDTEHIKALKGDAVEVVMIEGSDHSFNDPQHKSQLTQSVATWLSSLV